MIGLVRVLRVLLLLVLVLFTISFIIGIGRPETGVVEKVVLAALVAVCVVAAAKVSSLAGSIESRLHHREP